MTATHVHNYGADWKNDMAGHWHECACGEISGFVPHTLEWVVITAANETTDGLKHYKCTICGYVADTEIIPATGIANSVYTIINGAKGTWQKDAGAGYTITVDGDYAKFTGIKIDGVVSLSNYTAVSGSTIITLKEEYLKTLSAGEHTVEILFTDGSVSTTLTISEKTDSSRGCGGCGSVGDISDGIIGGLIIIVAVIVLLPIIKRKKVEKAQQKVFRTI